MRRFEDEYISNNQIIGQGAFAQVMLYTKKSTGEKVAVKEFCTGGSLYDLMVKKRIFTENEAIEIIGQVAKGILFLHQNNIVHRDIKPENVLVQQVGDSQVFKITDFGLSFAKDQINNRMTTTKVGTAYYVAPEILEGKEYDNTVDIWAMGLMFDELIHGSPFYNGMSEEEVFQKIRKESPYFIRSNNNIEWQRDPKKIIVREILMKTIQRDPKKRKEIPWVLEQIENYKKVVERRPSPIYQTKHSPLKKYPQQNLIDLDIEIEICKIHKLPLTFMVPSEDKILSCCMKCLQAFSIFEISDYNQLKAQAIKEFSTKGFDYYYKQIHFQKELNQMIETYQDSSFIIIQKDSLNAQFKEIGVKYMNIARVQFNDIIEKIKIGRGQDFLSQSLKINESGGMNRISQFMLNQMGKVRKDGIRECENILQSQIKSLLAQLSLEDI